MRPSIATFPKTTIIIHNIDRVVRNSEAISDWLSSKTVRANAVWVRYCRLFRDLSAEESNHYMASGQE